jgi:hypothetical protein
MLMADLEKMERMLVLIDLGHGIDDARKKGLIETKEDERIFKKLTKEANDIKRRGGIVDIPFDL